MRKELIVGDEIFVIHDLLSPEECEQQVHRCESAGFEDAPVTTDKGALLLKDIRNNSRSMFDDASVTAELFIRSRPFLPERLHAFWDVAGLNERLRYYRYDPGEKFSPHYDGAFERSETERSFLTFMIYLNDGFRGGETKFYEPHNFSVLPERGKALIFVHRRLHEGSAVLSGRKYVLRSDVMYTRAAQ